MFIKSINCNLKFDIELLFLLFKMANDTSQWTFYDFDKNWDEFYKVWKTDDVQNILKKDMDNWCINEASYTYMDDGTLIESTWSKGKPLWHLSRTNYHYTHVCNVVEDRIKKERMVYHYKKSMEQVFPSKYIKMSYGDLYEEFSSICFENIINECSPKPHTIESLILVMGKNYISGALHACALKLFPDNKVIFYNGNGKNSDTDNDEIYILEKKIVFDLLDFYYVTRDNSKIVPKPKYIPSVWDNESEISIEFSDEENSANSDFEYDSE
jgi:hypothetical protein